MPVADHDAATRSAESPANAASRRTGKATFVPNENAARNIAAIRRQSGANPDFRRFSDRSPPPTRVEQNVPNWNKIFQCGNLCSICEGMHRLGFRHHDQRFGPSLHRAIRWR
jgi:hypothetical protein